jgi:hypothetical protein
VSGAFALFVDGVEIAADEGVDTKDTAGDLATMWLRGVGGLTSTYTYFTDIYYEEIAAKANRLGPIRGRLLNATSDVSVDWTPDSGSDNYTQVQMPVGTGSYVDSDTLDDVDEYGLADLPSGVNSILGVTRITVGEAPDGGAPQISHGIKRGSTELYGVERNVGMGVPATQATHFATQPDLSPWTVAAVNDLVLLRKAV